MSALVRHDDSIWTLTLPHSMMGIQVGARSTILRLPSGGLMIVSPGPFGTEHLEAIRELGEVEALLAPNKFHHLFLGNAAQAFPRARVFFAPGLRERIPSLPPGVDLGEEPPALWGSSIGHAILQGTTTNEVAFFHRPSRTLILTDLAFNLRGGGLWTRIAMTLNGGYGRFGPSRVFRSTINDAPAFGRSLHEVARWDFDRVVVAHGDVLESDGHASFQRAFEPWLKVPLEPR